MQRVDDIKYIGENITSLTLWIKPTFPLIRNESFRVFSIRIMLISEGNPGIDK